MTRSVPIENKNAGGKESIRFGVTPGFYEIHRTVPFFFDLGNAIAYLEEKGYAVTCYGFRISEGFKLEKMYHIGINRYIWEPMLRKALKNYRDGNSPAKEKTAILQSLNAASLMKFAEKFADELGREIPS